MDLKNSRTEYEREELNQADLCASPIDELEKWLAEAQKITKYFNAATLSTVDEEGFPSSRIILAKDIKEGSLVFFTDYQSEKGKHLENNQNVSLLFFWPELDRQIRLKGIAQKLPRKESEAYFYSRPLESQISAMASRQSHPVKKEELYSRVQKIKETNETACPETWGGYKITLNYFEFWQGRPNRLHDRFIYKMQQNDWEISRLSP